MRGLRARFTARVVYGLAARSGGGDGPPRGRPTAATTGRTPPPASSVSAPEIDVVVPTLNCHDQLARSLDAIRGQSYGGTVHLWVVDGGSRDGSDEVARGAGAVVHVRPGEYATGLSGSRHFGERLGTAPLIWMLDADNVPVGPNVLSELVRPFVHDPSIDISVPLLDVGRHEPSFNRWLAWVESDAIDRQRAAGSVVEDWVVVPELTHGISNGSLVARASLEAAGGYDSDVRLLDRLRRLHHARAALVPRARIVHDQVSSARRYLWKASSRIQRFGAMTPEQLRAYFAEYPVPAALHRRLHNQLETGFVRAPGQGLRGWWRTGDRAWGWGLAYPAIVAAVAARHPIASWRVYRRFL